MHNYYYSQGTGIVPNYFHKSVHTAKRSSSAEERRGQCIPTYGWLSAQSPLSWEDGCQSDTE